MFGLDIPNFDVVDPRALGPQNGAPGQGLFAGLAPQQGAGTPVFNTVPAQGQPQPYQGSPLMAGLLGLPQYGAPAQGTAPVPQLQQPGGGLASAIGTGARSFFDGIMGARG